LKSNVVHLPPSKTQRWAAAGVCIVLVVLVAVTMPFATRPLPPVPAFLPIYLTLAVVADGFTAFLLLMQFRARGYAPLAVLCIAYTATAVMIVMQGFAFPGLFADHGLFGARPQTAVWLWTAWHGGFPTLVILFALGCRFFNVRVEPNRVALAAVVVLGLAIGTLASAIAYRAPLPTIVVGTSYALGFHGTFQTVLGLAVAGLVATVLLTGLSGVLDLWLSVALVGLLCDIVLTIFAGSRFSLGWYLGRVYAVVTSLTVAAFFVAEFVRLYTRFARLASVDPLTGLSNRRTFDERLDDELRAAAREKTPLALLMIDVDDFKRYNDTHGHMAGDDALRIVADATRVVTSRPRDMAARFGGEEFVIVLPGTDLDGSLTVAERVRNEVARRRIPHRTNRAAPFVTISVGAAAIVPDDELIDPRGLIERADAALYGAKSAGRNRVAVATTESAMGREE
jgi:diguanylate cyclase (GGDEF)-like protein